MSLGGFDLRIVNIDRLLETSSIHVVVQWRCRPTANWPDSSDDLYVGRLVSSKCTGAPVGSRLADARACLIFRREISLKGAGVSTSRYGFLNTDIRRN
jgi:hypothetical protein